MSKTIWNTDPTVTPIRDQAAARGEPIPVGKTVEELLALGYDVRRDSPLFAVLIGDATSPTGAYLAVPLAKFQEILDAGRGDLDEEVTLRVNEAGAEMFGRDAIMTASWIRKMSVLMVSPIVPGWATVRTLDVKDGYVVGVMWDRIQAQAPTDLDFEEESARRVAVGLPPLEDWRRPDKHEFKIATHIWMAKAVEGLGAVEAIKEELAEVQDFIVSGPPKEP